MFVVQSQFNIIQSHFTITLHRETGKSFLLKRQNSRIITVTIKDNKGTFNTKITSPRKKDVTPRHMSAAPFNTSNYRKNLF